MIDTAVPSNFPLRSSPSARLSRAYDGEALSTRMVGCFSGYNFEWDGEKAEANLRKHGVSFAAAVTVFGDPLSMNTLDPDHSDGEHRFIVMGMSGRYRFLVVSYMHRPPRTRIVNARLATRNERKQYEEK